MSCQLFLFEGILASILPEEASIRVILRLRLFRLINLNTFILNLIRFRRFQIKPCLFTLHLCLGRPSNLFFKNVVQGPLRTLDDSSFLSAARTFDDKWSLLDLDGPFWALVRIFWFGFWSLFYFCTILFHRNFLAEWSCQLDFDYFFVLRIRLWNRRLHHGRLILIRIWNLMEHVESQWMLEDDREGATLVVWEKCTALIVILGDIGWLMKISRCFWTGTLHLIFNLHRLAAFILNYWIQISLVLNVVSWTVLPWCALTKVEILISQSQLVLLNFEQCFLLVLDGFIFIWVLQIDKRLNRWNQLIGSVVIISDGTLFWCRRCIRFHWCCQSKVIVQFLLRPWFWTL